MSLVAANMPLGFLPDETVAALQTLAEAQADGQHINTIDDDSDGTSSDDDDPDGGFPWDFPEEAEDPDEAASRKRVRAECERDEAIMNKHDVEDAVIDAQEELLNDAEVCCKCKSAGHNDSLLLCDGGLNLRHLTTTGQGFKRRKPEQKCAVACHTFCCELPLQSSWLTVAGPASSAITAVPAGQGHRPRTTTPRPILASGKVAPLWCRSPLARLGA